MQRIWGHATTPLSIARDTSLRVKLNLPIQPQLAQLSNTSFRLETSIRMEDQTLPRTLREAFLRRVFSQRRSKPLQLQPRPKKNPSLSSASKKMESQRSTHQLRSRYSLPMTAPNMRITGSMWCWKTTTTSSTYASNKRARSMLLPSSGWESS